MKKIQGLLHHYNFYEQIIKRKDELEYLVNLIQSRLSHAPGGSLKIINKGNFFQYYHRNKKESNGEYISKSNNNLIAALAQKKYDTLFLAAAKDELNHLHHFLNKYSDTIPNIYSGFNDELKGMIETSDMDDNDYADWWMGIPFTPKAFSDETAVHTTDKGERVRSKSEVLIANTLNKLGIPYKYECPIVLADGSVRYPDFSILIVKSRRVIFHEHFGMMDNIEYMTRCFKKIQDYEASGYYPGIHYFMTFESKNNPINIKTIEKIIRVYTK